MAISLRGIKRINSFGVRGWIEAINRIPAGAQVSLVECPPPIIDQVNMFAGFVGKARIHSFYVPMTCECGHEEERLFTVVECQKNGNRVPTSSCPKCKERELEADIFEQQYLTFLQDA